MVNYDYKPFNDDDFTLLFCLMLVPGISSYKVAMTIPPSTTMESIRQILIYRQRKTLSEKTNKRRWQMK